jgi:hypothetical protein
MRAIWQTFDELSGRRQSGFVPNPLTNQELESWCRLNHVQLTHFEVQQIFLLDNLFLASLASSKDSLDPDFD